MQGEYKEASERLATLLQQAETQAGSAQQSSHLAVAASDLAAGLKAECESLTHSLRLKGDELGATWEGVRQTLSSLSLTTQQHASKAAEAVDSVDQVLAKAQCHTEASQRLQANLEAEQQQIGQRLMALDEMLEQIGTKVGATADNLQACERIKSEIGDAEEKLKKLGHTLEEHLRQTKGAREDVETLRKELRQHISTLQMNSVTFGRRLRWLFFGYKA
jgi:chromosome segregation ATPase